VRTYDPAKDQLVDLVDPTLFCWAQESHGSPPSPTGWEVYEAPCVQPVFLNQEQAISYAQGRACFRTGEIRILDSTGAVERTIPFLEADRTL
jgi:hypothetical protein